MLGVLALLFQPILVSLRAQELTNCLALTNFANRTFTTLPWTGQQVGTCVVMGFALTLAQMISASVAIVEPAGKTIRSRILKWLAISVMIIASLLDLALSVITAPGGKEQGIAFTVALLLTVGEPMAGILAIDCFLMPLVLATADAIRNLFRRGPKP